MKKNLAIALCLTASILFFGMQATAGQMSNMELTERVKTLENKLGVEDGEPGWFNRITLSGAIEVETFFSSAEFNDPAAEDVDESDIELATAELGIDVEIVKHVSGHMLITADEDDIVLDDAYITLDGLDVVPLYMHAGKLYVPFGQYESHMISDPLTLEIGETVQHAIQIGFAHGPIEANIAFFNPDVDEDGEDDTICGVTGNIVFSLPEDAAAGIGLSAGVSFISNMGDTDGLEGMIATADGAIDENVAGFGAFISVAFMEKVFVELEYIGALDSFRAGEMAFDGGVESEPSAWNIEVAFVPMDDLELAVRYEKSDDFTGGIDDEAPAETRYGIAGAYGLFDSTTLALEFMKSEFENDDDTMVVTAQLAIEF